MRNFCASLAFTVTILGSLCPFTAQATPSSIPFILPKGLAQESSYHLQYKPEYQNWLLFLGKTQYCLIWEQRNLTSPVLYITPHLNMITVDVIAPKTMNPGFHQPFIRWNIKNVTIVLNKTGEEKGWVKFSTTIYTENITKLIKALQEASPMNLVLSPLSVIPISTDGLPIALNDMTDLIRANNISAPQPLSLRAPPLESPAPPDGMSPDLVPLYQEVQNSYIQCRDSSQNPMKNAVKDQTCLHRNDLIKKLEQSGWCWGSGDPDQHDKDKNWRKCIMTPKGSDQKINKDVKVDFEKAKSSSKLNE